jgi:RNA polymerase sigma factor (TIGR02999 family)
VAPTIASLIRSAETGDRSAVDELFAALYSELHGLARSQLARGGRGATLGTTTLLHEAYLNISGREGPRFPDRSRFMAYAARVMRGLIIDYVRARQALKRGGGFEITTLGEEVVASPPDAEELSRIGDALDELAKVEPGLAELVDLKFFAGFTLADIGAMRGVSERTAQRQWERARTYLYGSVRREI